MNSSFVDLRPPTLRERKEFYASFPAEKAFEWAKSITARPVFAVDLGWYTGIVHPRLAPLLRKGYRIMWLRDVDSPSALRRKLLRYLPESVYYWRSVVSDPSKCAGCPHRRNRKMYCFYCPNFLGQELMFDIDPKHAPGTPKRAFTLDAFEGARQRTLEALDFLSGIFERLQIVFSGRGFHIHVLDRDAFTLPPSEREALARRVGADIPVSRGGVSLARLPYTLNGVTGQSVVLLDRKKLESFEPWDYHSSSSSKSSSSS